MQVARLTKLAGLSDPRLAWNRLTHGMPFRRWEWLESWWRHYGQIDGRPRPHHELFVLAVLDDKQLLAGVAPWYLQRTAAQGAVVRFLGDGEVCSEYASLLCRSGDEEAVASALADWLTEQGPAGNAANGWDCLHLEAVADQDLPVVRLLDHLAGRGNAVYRTPGANCWRLALPATWDQYLAMLSKGHRKQLRRLDRDFFRSGRAVMHWVHRPADLDHAMNVLVELHQQRWRHRGCRGCFSSKRFLDFHRAAAARLLAQDCLLMSWLELDGRPVAAEYHLAEAGVVYAYQSGISPERLKCGPGRLSNLATIRRAIERGDQYFDFLRGDEPYKAHWRAKPLATLEARVVPGRIAARLRQGVRAAGDNMVHWIKSGWHLAGNLLGE